MSFEAKYSGSVCADCGNLITPGDLVEFNEENRLEHVDCQPTEQDRHDRKPPCPNCFLIHAGECA